MDLNLFTNKISDIAKDISQSFLKEIKNYIENQNLTDDSKIELQNKKNEIIKSFGEVYEVRDRGVYKYNHESKYPEFRRELYTGQKNGFYLLKNDELIYEQYLNEEINQKINKAKKEIIENQNKYLEECRKVGEEYSIDELGDDKKTMYLIRESDKLEFQDFKLSDELYEEIQELNKNKVNFTLVWNGDNYEIKK